MSVIKLDLNLGKYTLVQLLEFLKCNILSLEEVDAEINKRHKEEVPDYYVPSSSNDFSEESLSKKLEKSESLIMDALKKGVDNELYKGILYSRIETYYLLFELLKEVQEQKGDSK